MLHFNTKLNKMKSTISKMKSEITSIQKKNEESIGHIPKHANCSSMQNLFQPSNVQSGTANSPHVNVSQINADNYTNYFILPKSSNKSSNVPSARENALVSNKNNSKTIASIKQHIELPIKLTYNKDIDTAFESSSHRQAGSKIRSSTKLQGRDHELSIRPRNNMFHNFTQDIVPKKPGSIRGKYNSFDCRAKKHAIGGGMDCESKVKEEEHKTIIDLIGKVYNYDAYSVNLAERVKSSSIKAREVDELAQELITSYKKIYQVDQFDYSHMGDWIQSAEIRHQLYAQEIELYRALCEDLIHHTDLNQLEEIAGFAYSLQNNSMGNLDDHPNGNFIRSVNAMIRNKYLASERQDDPPANSKHMPKLKAKSLKY